MFGFSFALAYGGALKQLPGAGSDAPDGSVPGSEDFSEFLWGVDQFLWGSSDMFVWGTN